MSICLQFIDIHKSIWSITGILIKIAFNKFLLNKNNVIAVVSKRYKLDLL